MKIIREWARERKPLLAAAAFPAVAMGVLIVVSLAQGH